MNQLGLSGSKYGVPKLGILTEHVLTLRTITHHPQVREWAFSKRIREFGAKLFRVKIFMFQIPVAGTDPLTHNYLKDMFNSIRCPLDW